MLKELIRSYLRNKEKLNNELVMSWLVGNMSVTTNIVTYQESQSDNERLLDIIEQVYTHVKDGVSKSETMVMGNVQFIKGGEKRIVGGYIINAGVGHGQLNAHLSQALGRVTVVFLYGMAFIQYSEYHVVVMGRYADTDGNIQWHEVYHEKMTMSGNFRTDSKDVMPGNLAVMSLQFWNSLRGLGIATKGLSIYNNLKRQHQTNPVHSLIQPSKEHYLDFQELMDDIASNVASLQTDRSLNKLQHTGLQSRFNEYVGWFNRIVKEMTKR